MTTGRVSAWFADVQAATAFLTRLPVGWPRSAPSDQLARACAHFPLIGAGLGAGAGLSAWGLLALGAPAWVAAGLAVTLLILVTGGLHEDGLADTADGLGGGATRDAKLAIMRDHQVGSYGALALIVSVLLRVAAIAALTSGASDGITLVVVLALAGAASRTAMVGVFALVLPARIDGLAATQRPGSRTCAIACLWTVVLLPGIAIAGLGPATGALLAAGIACMAVIAAAALAGLARRALGGHTGDVLGAVQQVAEIAGLIAATIILGAPA